MSKILLSMVAASALAGAALPAAAQDFRHDGPPPPPPMAGDRFGHGDDRFGDRGDRYDRGGGYGGIDARQSAIKARIDFGARTGQLTRREVRDLRSNSYDIARLEYRYRMDGLNGWERADLNRRLDRLDYKLSEQMRDDERYGYGYGGRDRDRYGRDRPF